MKKFWLEYMEFECCGSLEFIYKANCNHIYRLFIFQVQVMKIRTRLYISLIRVLALIIPIPIWFLHSLFYVRSFSQKVSSLALKILFLYEEIWFANHNQVYDLINLMFGIVICNHNETNTNNPLRNEIRNVDIALK